MEWPKQKVLLWKIAIFCVVALAQQDVVAANLRSANELSVIAADVQAELIEAHQTGTRALMQLLERPIPKSLEAPLQSESKAVYKGKSLPSFFLSPRPPMYDYSDIRYGELFGTTDEEYRLSNSWIVIISTLAEKEPTPLVNWLAARCDRIPPTSSDLIVSVALESCGWDRQSERFWEETREKWNRMLRAKNPIYRLAAFQNLDKFEKDRSRKLAACDSALHEANTIFQFWAIEELKQLPGKESMKLLEWFIKKVSVTNDGTLAMDLDIVDCAKEVLAEHKTE